MALLNPLVWQGLYKVGKALVNLIKLDEYVKVVCKVRAQPRGDEKKVKQGKSLAWIIQKQRWQDLYRAIPKEKLC